MLPKRQHLDAQLTSQQQWKPEAADQYLQCVERVTENHKSVPKKASFKIKEKIDTLDKQKTWSLSH